MDLLEKNLKLLEQHYPGIRKNLDEAEEQQDGLRVFEEQSEDCEKILKIQYNHHLCYLAGKRNAKQPPHEWLEEQEQFSDSFTYIFMGIGNTGYLRELMEHVNVRLNIIIYEPSLQIFLKSLETMDLEEGMNRHLIIFWVEGVGYMTLDKLRDISSKFLKLEKITKVQLFILPNYDILFPKLCDQIVEQCNNIALDNRVSYNTQVYHAEDTAINAMKNAKYLCHACKTVQLFQTIPVDITGILVAAGPSLNKNIQELKKAKGKAFIIAVDTAIKPLLNAGIIPDMFFIVDAKKIPDLVMTKGAQDIPLVTTLDAAPKVLEYHKGKKFFFDEGYQFAQKIIARSGLPWGDVCTGGSVATNIFSLFYKICLKTIILVGQDLALTGNRSHADGTFEEKMPEIDTSDCEWVEGNYEEKVPTRTDLKVFLNWYEAEIRRYKERFNDFRVINATEGGAKIEGTELMTLKEAIAETCTKNIDIKDCIDRIPPMLNDQNQKWAKEYLKSIPAQFDSLRKNTLKLNRSYCRLDVMCKNNQINSEQYIKLLKKIKNQIKRIESYDTYQLVIFVIPSAEQIMREEEYERLDSVKKEGFELARKGKLYTSLVAETASLLRDEAKKIYDYW